MSSAINWVTHTHTRPTALPRHFTVTAHDRQTDSYMARCVTFAVARIRVGNRRILHIFPSGTQSMGDRGSKKAYTGPRLLPTKFGCDRSIVVGCRSRNDRQTDRQTEWNDNKAHSLRTWRNSTHGPWLLATQQTCLKDNRHGSSNVCRSPPPPTTSRVHILLQGDPEKRHIVYDIRTLQTCVTASRGFHQNICGN